MNFKKILLHHKLLKKDPKLFVQGNANYNLYFSTTLESNSDEQIEINTGKLGNFTLPGIDNSRGNNNNLNN
ncbi:MAG: hypothetical protein ACOC11_00620 [Prolixibacteraceae bacterium]